MRRPSAPRWVFTLALPVPGCRPDRGRFLDAYTLRFELAADEVAGSGDLAYCRS